MPHLSSCDRAAGRTVPNSYYTGLRRTESNHGIRDANCQVSKAIAVEVASGSLRG